jgi:hypothetical protein
MALPGMKSTADFTADERPRNWREGILRLKPRNDAQLFTLTSMMKSERTTDPEFTWWEEPLFMYTFTLGADVTIAATTWTLVSGGLRLKPGDTLKVGATGEVVRVITVISDTSITVERARGAGGTPAGTATGVDIGPDDGAIVGVGMDSTLLYIGSAYREGAPRSVGTSTAPSKKYNYTQIFRDPVEITRTAQQSTAYRTGDPFAADKARTAHKHALGVERAFWFGSRYETLESAQPIRYTGGVTDFIPAANIYDAGGTLTMSELLGQFNNIFAFGSGEKVAFGSVKMMSLISQLVSLQGSIQLEPGGTKEYGIDTRRIFTAAGTLRFIEHPAFSATPYLQNDLFVLDTENLRYRHLQDTTYLRNRQDAGVDGKADEFLTEAGLEVQHGTTHYWLRNMTAVAKDV